MRPGQSAERSNATRDRPEPSANFQSYLRSGLRVRSRFEFYDLERADQLKGERSTSPYRRPVPAGNADKERSGRLRPLQPSKKLSSCPAADWFGRVQSL